MWEKAGNLNPESCALVIFTQILEHEKAVLTRLNFDDCPAAPTFKEFELSYLYPILRCDYLCDVATETPWETGSLGQMARPFVLQEAPAEDINQPSCKPPTLPGEVNSGALADLDDPDVT